jgi:hypothetical protein
MAGGLRRGVSVTARGVKAAKGVLHRLAGVKANHSAMS